MTAPTPIKTKRRTVPNCSTCGTPMRLFGIEAHHIISQADLRTYVCVRCDGMQTETVTRSKTKATPNRRAVMLELVVNEEAFDPETTHLLGSAFDAACRSARVSGALASGNGREAATRELLAKHLIAMVRRGERDPDRLVEEALRRLTDGQR
jgi:hypothetical protein